MGVSGAGPTWRVLHHTSPEPAHWPGRLVLRGESGGEYGPVLLKPFLNYKINDRLPGLPSLGYGKLEGH